MRCELETKMSAIGRELRRLIKSHKEDTGRSYRHLSAAIRREPNYIASYLSKPASQWAIPKHPTFGLLLKELGVTEEVLNEAAYEKSAKAQGHAG